MVKSYYPVKQALLCCWLGLGLWFGVNESLRAEQAPAEPPAPKPSAAAQKSLDEATEAKPPEEILKGVDRALSVAREANDPAGEAQAHRQRALGLESQGRTAEAEAAWQDAALALYQAGYAAERQEDLSQTRQYWTAALALQERYAPNSLAIAKTLGSLGHIALLEGNLKTARRHLACALALHEQLAPNSLDMAGSLNGLGNVLVYQGDLAAAQSYHERALAIQEYHAPDSLAVADSLNGFGAVAGRQGNTGAARAYVECALTLREQQAPDSLEVARSLGSLGRMASAQGDLAAARRYFERALALREQHAPNSRSVAGSIESLGRTARLQGDLAAARGYYERSLALQQKHDPNSLEVVTSLNGLGYTLAKQGDLRAARIYHEQALAILESQAPNSLNMALTLTNLGAIGARQGDLAAARAYHARALAIREQQAPRSYQVSESLSNLGTVADEQGDLAAARAYMERSLAIGEQTALRPISTASTLNELGTIFWKQGDVAAAELYYRRALALREKLTPNSLDVAASLGNLGRVAERSGDLAEAERLWQQAWQIVRRQAADVTGGDEALQAFGASTAAYATHLIRCQLARGKVTEAFLTLEEGRAQALQQLMLERPMLTAAMDSRRWPEYQAAVIASDRAKERVATAGVAEIRAQRAWEEKPKEGADRDAIAHAETEWKAAAGKLEAAQSAYTRARVKVDQLWAAMKAQRPRAFIPPLTPEQAQSALPKDTLFAAFSVDKQQTYLFLLTSTGAEASSLSAYTIPIPRKQLEERVASWRKVVANRHTSLAQVSAAGRDFFATLFPEKVRAALVHAERLLISPDGPLWEAPFAALVTNTQGAPRYLGAEKAITYTPSLATFDQSHRDAPRVARDHPLTAVVVGDPIFDPKDLRRNTRAPRAARSTDKQHYMYLTDQPPARLYGTRQEAVAIARLYQGVLLTGAAATETALRQHIVEADVIHLATHGYLLTPQAMSSGVLLTVPEKAPAIGETANDGVLQAWEIQSQLQIKAELVVLSACETGRGQIVPGEGLIGMTRALQYAGARSIVASQWQVSDQSTRTLMVAFHRQVRAGIAKDQALRAAMRLVREQEGTAHPYYWAAFLLTGDPDNPVVKSP